MGSDVGQIFPTASLHRDHSISYALVCEKEISHPRGQNFNQPLNAFANRAEPDQAALVRAAWSGSTLFAYGTSDPIQMDLVSNFFVLCTKMKVYLYNCS